MASGNYPLFGRARQTEYPLLQQLATKIEKLTFCPTDILFVHLAHLPFQEEGQVLRDGFHALCAKIGVTIPIVFVSGDGDPVDLDLLPCASMNRQSWFHRSQLEALMPQWEAEGHGACCTGLRELLKSSHEGAVPS